MTDIHKLHTDGIPSEEIVAKMKSESIIYEYPCLHCMYLIDKYIINDQNTLESLEIRIAALERELKERPVVEHNKIICIDAVKKIFGENENGK